MAIFIELLLIGVGLSMDAFAVSICKGLAMRRVNKKQALVIGLGLTMFATAMMSSKKMLVWIRRST